MQYRAIISEAWSLTQSNKRLIWAFAFVPAILSTLVGVVYAGYQVAAFWTSPYINPDISEDKHALRFIATIVLDLLRAMPGLTVLLLVICAIVVLAYLMVPVFTQGALIQTLARLRAGQEISIAEGVSFGFSRFLQLFEYHLLVRTFSFFSLLTEMFFAYRNLGPTAFEFFGWIFLLVISVGLLLTLLFTYSEYYIVIDKEGVMTSILKSCGLVMRQWHHTLFMLFLMAVIVVRLAINVLAALLLPLLVVAPLFIFTSLTLAKIGVAVGAVLALVGLYFISYFLGVFHVFTTGVWTFTFLELTAKEKNDIDLHTAAVKQETCH
jgi:hypothetical protein